MQKSIRSNPEKQSSEFQYSLYPHLDILLFLTAQKQYSLRICQTLISSSAWQIPTAYVQWSQSASLLFTIYDQKATSFGDQPHTKILSFHPLMLTSNPTMNRNSQSSAWCVKLIFPVAHWRAPVWQEWRRSNKYYQIVHATSAQEPWRKILFWFSLKL